LEIPIIEADVPSLLYKIFNFAINFNWWQFWLMLTRKGCLLSSGGV
jgi:hypothetical protein